MPSQEAIEVRVCTGCCCWDAPSQRIISSFVGNYGKKLGDIFTGDCSFTAAGKKFRLKEHGCFGQCNKAPLLQVGDGEPRKYENVVEVEAMIAAA